MMRIKSIRTQLAVYLVLGFVVLELLAGIGLYAYVEEALEHALETALATKADQIASDLHVEVIDLLGNRVEAKSTIRSRALDGTMCTKPSKS